MAPVAAFVAAAAVGHSGGWFADCNRAGATYPISWSREIDTAAQSHFALHCSGLDCTLTGASPFKGFIISSRDVTLQPLDGSLTTSSGGYCLTHTNGKVEKSQVTFRAAGPTVLWATVVTRRISAGDSSRHQYALAPPYLVNGGTVGTVWIVGGGPGGLAAARYATAIGLTAHVLERGPKPHDTFYTDPISNTFLLSLPEQYKYTPIPGITIASMFGGNQNANGAVYSPGTPEDLADSTGMPVAAARHAQATAAGYVYHRDAVGINSKSVVALMQQCRPAALATGSCTHALIAPVADTVSRRSIAYSFPDGIVKDTDTTVTRITDERIYYTTTGTTQTTTTETYYELGPNDVVVLAAGALQSPQLLNQKQFYGYNHYYRTDGEPLSSDWVDRLTAETTQLFEYRGDYEFNYAFAVNPDTGNLATMNISMIMKPPHRVLYDTTQPTNDENKAAYGQDAWHYMGTVDHTRMHIAGKMYSGDAGALKKPFNCHTSMPAAAAGIMAVDAAAGTTPEDPLPDQDGTFTGAHPWLFAAGILVAGLGVLAHVASGRIDKLAHSEDLGKKLHFVLMPLSVGLIIAGVIFAAYAKNTNGTSLLTKSFSYHSTFGYILLAALVLQTAWGIQLSSKDSKDRATWARRAHRGCGFVLLLLLGAIAIAMISPRNSPIRDFKHKTAIIWSSSAAAGVAGVAAVAAMATNAFGTWPKDERRSDDAAIISPFL